VSKQQEVSPALAPDLDQRIRPASGPGLVSSVRAPAGSVGLRPPASNDRGISAPRPPTSVPAAPMSCRRPSRYQRPRPVRLGWRFTGGSDPRKASTSPVVSLTDAAAPLYAGEPVAALLRELP